MTTNGEIVPTAYCQTMVADHSVVEKCNGNKACIQKEFEKCLKTERYFCEPGFDKGKSVNCYLKEKGFTVQSIIATQHQDYTTNDSIVKADYIRADSPNGYPFVIYLDAKGYIETEGCITEMTCIRDKCFVSDSTLKAGYQMCVPAVRGIALFTNQGISTAMYNQRMQMVAYNHEYLNVENSDENIVDVAVPYPILPLSEIMCKPEIVCERLKFVIDPLRKLFVERALKSSKQITCKVDKFPTLLCNFYTQFFEKLKCLEQSIVELRDTLKYNQEFKCPCVISCRKKKVAFKCECEKQRMIDITLYNIRLRERYVNEMIALFTAYTTKMSIINNLNHDITFMQEILDDRYCDFSNLKVDPSASCDFV